MVQLCASTIGMACLIALVGCNAGMSGKSETYQAGYSSGCRSGQVNAGRPGPPPWRDDALYRSDAQYAAGWNDGARECYAAEMARPHDRGGGGAR